MSNEHLLIVGSDTVPLVLRCATCGGSYTLNLVVRDGYATYAKEVPLERLCTKVDAWRTLHADCKKPT